MLFYATQDDELVTRQDIEKAAAQAEKENALFADKACLDGLEPSAGVPVGRAEKAGSLSVYLFGKDRI